MGQGGPPGVSYNNWDPSSNVYPSVEHADYSVQTNPPLHYAPSPATGPAGGRHQNAQNSQPRVSQSRGNRRSMPQSQLPLSRPDNPVNPFNGLPQNTMDINNFFTMAQSMPWMNQGLDGAAPPFIPPMNPTLSYQNVRPMSTMAGLPQQPIIQVQDHRRTRSPTREKTPPVQVPSPTQAYMQQSSQEPQQSPSKRPLLIILDLNGTLIFRKKRIFPPKFASRAGLDQFLASLIKNYSVMVWTSSQPPTMKAVCEKIFPGAMHDKVVAMWGRDKFGLTQRQYNNKLQVYKQLHKVWDTPSIQSAFPGNEALREAPAAPVTTNRRAMVQRATEKLKAKTETKNLQPGHRWDQTNTVLIDDSKIKALSEPFNILEIPEFTNDQNIDESTLFAKILHRLDILSHHDDVSKVLRVWNERVEKGEGNILDLDLGPMDDLDLEDGGMVLPTEVSVPVTANITASREKKQPKAQQPILTEEEKQEQKAATRRAKKQRQKARKAEIQSKKDQKAAAEVAAEVADLDIDQSVDCTAPVAATAPATTGSNKKERLPRQHKYSLRLQGKEHAISHELPEVLDGATDSIVPETSSTSASTATVAADVASSVTEGDESRPHIETSGGVTGVDADAAQDSEPEYQPRSPSPATSIASQNSLLDRLEEGLGMKR
ncbi:hypothetical protein N7508_007026 [Penicillium antarcticum]|uniref:uncharacterized protein n=1 Tax=Penicillium antarcticum TaxID=416450 RepID=UPI002391DC5C|nr:uncharacterized protein N7508_007026 [Penicillium antarcticum]KAJ5302163.1 hypothetical protein N7508_007026 [Penicillium antarcticum]